jgi:uncharacterized protein (TIGR00251 family)
VTIAETLKQKLLAEKRLVLQIKVIPKSPRNEIVGYLDDGALKIKVAAPPERGKANDELCRFLARELDVPQRNVSVIQGHTSHQKRVQALL